MQYDQHSKQNQSQYPRQNIVHGKQKVMGQVN